MSQATPEMAPECDSHWPNPSTSSTHSHYTGSSDAPQSGGANRKRSTNEGLPQLDEEQVIQIATEAFVKELGLENDSVLKDGKIQIREVPAGTYIMKEESHKVKKYEMIIFISIRDF